MGRRAESATSQSHVRPYTCGVHQHGCHRVWTNTCEFRASHTTLEYWHLKDPILRTSGTRIKMKICKVRIFSSMISTTFYCCHPSKDAPQLPYSSPGPRNENGRVQDPSHPESFMSGSGSLPKKKLSKQGLFRQMQMTMNEYTRVLGYRTLPRYRSYVFT